MNFKIYVQYIYSHVFKERNNCPVDKGIFQFYDDLFRIYGTEIDFTPLLKGNNNSFINMSDLLISKLIKSKGTTYLNPDLLIIAYSTPDINPAISTTSYLNYRYKWTAQAFGVTNQGAFSPFTSFEIIANYFSCSNFKQALLILLEQNTFPRMKLEEEIINQDFGCILLLTKDSSPIRLLHIQNESIKTIQNSVIDIEFLLDKYSISNETINVVTNNNELFKRLGIQNVILHNNFTCLTPFFEFCKYSNSNSSIKHFLIHFQDESQSSVLLFEKS